MLTKAKELLPLMKRIIEYSGSIHSLEARQEDGSSEGNPEEMERLKQEYAALLEGMSREDLLLIRTVANIGNSERGHRFSREKGKGEIQETIFEIEIRSTPEELLTSYHQYLVYHTKEQEIQHFRHRLDVPRNLSDGIQILGL
ncbi:hypothetical protein ABEX25_03580 [Paenibacillus thiaminolyticus]|uniref:hypothetical protein n=1 Tax=Paenibacillus thiaminolyticus TaxID=49283 RepID=UPI003D296E4E